jgi:serine/threonine-protein kinase RIO1
VRFACPKIGKSQIKNRPDKAGAVSKNENKNLYQAKKTHIFSPSACKGKHHIYIMQAFYKNILEIFWLIICIYK